AALTEQVDGATLVDLFDSEDWWAPFRGRQAAIVAGGHLLAVRGDKDLPAPLGLPARGPDAFVSAGLLVGARPFVAAVAPITLTRRTEPTSLMLAAPFDAAALARALGAPVALSDGHRLVASTGDGAQAAIFAAVPGKEEAGRYLAEAAGELAVAAPASANAWVWTLVPLPAPVAAGPASDPRLWLGVAALLAIGALLFGRARGRAVAADAGRTTPAGHAAGGTALLGEPEPAHRNAVVHIGSGNGLTDEERRSTAKMGTPRTPASDPVLFGRYRLLRRLDGGGMADIYTAALHGAEGFRRVFVIKRLRPELARNRNAVEQFIDEAKLGSTLVHPNIVPVFDFGKVGDEYFMAQEYIVGRDISRLLHRHLERFGRPLDERLMLYIAHDVLDGLAYAHAQTDADGRPLGLVHRDIAPGNIMVTHRGEVKLFDFGIVKATGPGRVSKTETGVVKGNVGFMSPEQARGQAVDPRSDLFSLGLVMYYGLVDEQIYKGDGTFEQLLQAASGPTPEQLAKIDHLPVAGPVVRRALSVDPAQRFQDAAAFAAALAPHVAGCRAEAAALMQQLFGDELRAPLAG
ncbi:MAG TPA: serine/threonine-protein kinase, partial [Polyangia bacterium]|nr:serine/threonine-protein kinase [Polyangia bacterium]